MTDGFNPKSLKSVREQRKLSLTAAADALGIGPHILGMMEQGDRLPTWRQVEKIADLYNIRESALFEPGIINLEDTPIDFRKRGTPHADLSAGGLKRIWKTEKIAEFTAALINELGDRVKNRK